MNMSSAVNKPTYCVPGQAWSSKRLTSTSAHTYVSNLQLPFSNQRKGEDGCRNNFMINLYERYAAELGFELAIPGSEVRRATDCAIGPG